MTELKFKGKAVEGIWKDKWIYSNYYKRHLDENYQFIRDYLVYKNQDIKVDNKSISMFTGVYDKNNKEIYENDIVRFYSNSLEGDTYGLVKYWNKNTYHSYYIQFYKFDGNSVRGDSRYNRNLVNGSDYEVIGNLIDNKELLISYSKSINFNRIIKFKAKFYDSELFNSWYFGQFYFLETNEETIYYIYSPSNGKIRINPTTLCQYTGFNDSSGNEIYENDIIYFKESDLEGIVYWDYISGSYRITYNTPIPKGSSLTEGLGICPTYIIINNYFDRPDLQESMNIYDESKYINKEYDL